MESIKFIKDIWYDGPDRTVYCNSRSLRASRLFVRQGDLDSSCSVYSLMMMLMIHRKVNYRELYSREEAQRLSDGGFNSVMRLQDEFLRNLKGYYREEERGFFFEELQEKLKSCFNKEAKAHVFQCRGCKSNSAKKKELNNMIIKRIDEGSPVEVGFTFEKNKGGHAVVAIGYTFHKNLLRLFCLDPGFDRQKTAFWNSIIDIEYKKPTQFVYTDLYITPDSSEHITVDEILTIE